MCNAAVDPEPWKYGNISLVFTFDIDKLAFIDIKRCWMRI